MTTENETQQTAVLIQSEPDTPVTEMLSAQPEETTESQESVPEAVPSPPHKRHTPLLILCIFLLLFLTVSGILFLCALRPVSIEAGSDVPQEEAFLRIPFLPLHCTTTLDDDALSEIGTHKITFTLFRIPLHTTLTVSDTTPPQYTLRDYGILLGDEITAEHFLAEASDFSAFFCELEGSYNASAAGEYPMTIILYDEWNNRVTDTVMLSVYGVGNTLLVEAGCTPEACLELLLEHVPEAELLDNFNQVVWNVPGTYPVSLRIRDTIFSIGICVEDTIAPTAVLQKVSTLRDRPVSVDEFIVSTDDVTEVIASFDGEIDFSVTGTQQITIRLTDAGGNISFFTTSLQIYNIPSSCTIEAGSSNNSVLQTIYLGELPKMFPSFAQPTNTASLSVGEHTVGIKTPAGIFDVLLKVVDTTPPAATGKRMTIYLSDKTRLEPLDFVYNIRDVSEVTASFVVEPDYSVLGAQNVTVLLTDAYGNSRNITANIYVSAEPAPPVISGVRDLSVYIGGRISYISGVTAVDTDGNSLTVTVDSSAVRLNQPGHYRISYHVEDSRGKTASVVAYVTVLDITDKVIQPYADRVFASIIKDGMTKLQKARAIYDWVIANMSYKAYADKSNWRLAAYTGFTTGRGDCYVYYAMSRFLLTAAGIDNLEICRDNPNKPHYWNLVNCGSGWYHFDTCPHYKQFPLESFMLTDAEVKAYSDNCVQDYYSFDASLYPRTP